MSVCNSSLELVGGCGEMEVGGAVSSPSCNRLCAESPDFETGVESVVLLWTGEWECESLLEWE